MQDRRRRTALHLPPPSGPVLLQRERQSSPTGPSGSSESPSGSSGVSGPGKPDDSGSGTGPGAHGSSDDNPFAPPPEGRPDQPWRPRHPDNGGSPDDGSGSDGDRPVWGSQWSNHQPGRSPGGFGTRPSSQNTQNPQQGRPGQGGNQGGPEAGRGLRWDPTDPAQRRARYALLAGMWAFFFGLFNFPEIALLLGALGLYWGISSLRGKQPQQRAEGQSAAGRPDPFNAPPAPSAEPSNHGQAQADRPARAVAQGGQRPTTGTGKPQTTAAVSGIVTAGIALAIVAATFTVQLVYRDYYTCVNDALTQTGQVSCNSELPHSLVPAFGIKE